MSLEIVLDRLEAIAVRADDPDNESLVHDRAVFVAAFSPAVALALLARIRQLESEPLCSTCDWPLTCKSCNWGCG